MLGKGHRQTAFVVLQTQAKLEIVLGISQISVYSGMLNVAQGAAPCLLLAFPCSLRYLKQYSSWHLTDGSVGKSESKPQDLLGGR